MSRRLTILTAALLLAAPLHAQQRIRINPETRQTAITLNPFAVFAAYFAGDVEHRVSQAFTLGAGATLAGGEFDSYRAMEAKVRYYPAEKALLGFSVAGTIGVSSGKDEDCSFNGSQTSCTFTRRNRPSVGTELSYQWIVGPSARFVVVTGAGLKRLFGDDGNTGLIDVNILPTARVNIGFAF